MKPMMTQDDLGAILEHLQEAVRALNDARYALNAASWEMEQPLMEQTNIHRRSDALLRGDEVIFLGMTQEASGVISELSNQAEALRHRISQYRRQLKTHPIAYRIGRAADDVAATDEATAREGGER